MTRRIMVVDDDALIRETLVAHFRDGGIDVSEAASAELALAAVGRLAPDVVITDVRMGGMDGFTLLRRSRSAMPDVDGAGHDGVRRHADGHRRHEGGRVRLSREAARPRPDRPGRRALFAVSARGPSRRRRWPSRLASRTR